MTPDMETGVREFYYMPLEYVKHYWSNIEECLDASPEVLEGFSRESIQGFLFSGQWHVWSVQDVQAIRIIIFTEVIQQPTRRFLLVRYAYGTELEQFLPLAEEGFKLVARKLGCSDVYIADTRFGWARKLKQAGFEVESVTLRLRVDSPTLN